MPLTVLSDVEIFLKFLRFFHKTLLKKLNEKILSKTCKIFNHLILWGRKFCTTQKRRFDCKWWNCYNASNGIQQILVDWWRNFDFRVVCKKQILQDIHILVIFWMLIFTLENKWNVYEPKHFFHQFQAKTTDIGQLLVLWTL